MNKNDTTDIIKAFKTFINAHKCENKNEITHTTYSGGRYSFEDLEYQEFMDKYIQVLKTGPKIDLTFIERPNRNGVTFLFIDIDYDHKGMKRLYNEDHIKQIIQTTNEFIKENFNVTRNQLTTFVTEKPKPCSRDKENKMYKDGFHIYYPYLAMKEKYRYYTIDYLIELMKEDKFLDGIAYKNNREKIVDSSIIKSNGITMIGSKKTSGEPYTLTHVYNSNLDEQDVEDYDNEELIYILSNQKYDIDASIEPKDVNGEDEIVYKIEDIYKQYNGGNKKKIICDINEENQTEENVREKTVTTEKKILPKKKTVEHNRDIEMAKELSKIFDKKRAHEYTSWKRVGFALHAVDESLYEYFVAFSKKDIAKYNEGKTTCESIWKSAKEYDQYYSIGTIRHWARLDNATEYYKIIRRLNDTVFGKAETSKHVDIAQVVYELYKDRFVCVDIVKKKWYEFQDHRWVFVQSAYTLEELISDEVRRMMTMYCSEKLSAAAANTNGLDHDNDYRKYNKLMKMIDNLGDVKFRENIVRACANKFFDGQFQEKLDTNSYLVGFLNGVYDLKELCFRDGLPTDYVSKTVGYEWKHYDINDQVFVKINKFFSEIQTEKDMREYLLTFIASVLRGIPDQKVHIWTGSGGNGKSATVELMKNMLGEYFGVVPVTILTRKRGSASGPTPEMADKFGTRCLIVQEPEHNDVVYVGQMKEYSGKDTILARPMYGDPFYFVPQFTMILTCNNLPHIPATDDGTWRRLRVTPFESQFVDENPKGPRQFLKDEEFQEDFPNWAQPLMWLIITQYFPKYAKGVAGKSYKITEPEKVKQFTKNYKMDSDAYMEFLNDNIVVTHDKDDQENIAFLFEAFRQWYAQSYTDKPPAKKTFIKYLEKNEYKMDKQNLYGVKYALELS